MSPRRQQGQRTRYAATKQKLERDKDDYEHIACGGTRRGAYLKTELIIKVEKEYIDSLRAKLTPSDNVLRDAISRYDVAEVQMSKIAAGGEQFHREGHAAFHASYDAFTEYEKASKRVLAEETPESEAAAVNAYKTWQAARKIDNEHSELSKVRQNEYSAASDEYKAAFHAVLQVAP